MVDQRICRTNFKEHLLAIRSGYLLCRREDVNELEVQMVTGAQPALDVRGVVRSTMTSHSLFCDEWLSDDDGSDKRHMAIYLAVGTAGMLITVNGV